MAYLLDYAIQVRANCEWRVANGIPIRHSPLPIRPSSRLQRALHAGVDRVQRRRAADIESVPLLTAEAQIGDRLRDVDLAEQIAILGVAAHAVFVGIAPTHRAPDVPLSIAADT